MNIPTMDPVKHYGTVHQDFTDLSARLETYANWPRRVVQTPLALAEAGFFSCKQDDKVQCAYCGGYLRCWEPTDDPFVEHLKHFPNCHFIQTTMAFKKMNLPQSGLLRRTQREMELGSQRRCEVDRWERVAGRCESSLEVVDDSPPNRDNAAAETDANTGREINLKREFKRIRECHYCKVCRQNEVAVVFLPCGHMACCIPCTGSVYCCPICNKKIVQTIRVSIA
ncbi:putative inhibitor of apoptosis [Gigantopelta aegis]|uniref:putative inhibitor of apoptosis n=1 Tax=Gigantopelta aegis TaxID=1735272 RepID=UPI001B88B423|nr:putative inhibitor of apoptosis [Gigantopelta aegis]